MTRMPLQTDRMILREPVEADKSAIRRQLSNFEVSKWLAKVPHPYPVGHEDLWWERVLERRALGFTGYYVMVLKEDRHEKAIGSIPITPLGEGHCRMGYWLEEPYWRRGLMSEAVTAVIKDCFGRQGYHTMEAGVFIGNEGSERILRNQGFEEISVSDEWCEARGEKRPHFNLLLKSSQFSL